MANMGRKFEIRSHQYLESIGYTVHTVQPPPAVQRTMNGKTIWMSTGKQDLFSMFDHVAIKRQYRIMKENKLETMMQDIAKEYATDDLYQPKIVFIQTKSRKQYGKELEKYDNFPHMYCFVFYWEKGDNRRYPKEPAIQHIGLYRKGDHNAK